MDATTATLVGLVILALLVIAFFSVFRGKGKFSIKTKLGEARAEGENPPPPTAVPAGVKVHEAEAGGTLRAQSTSSGGVDLAKVKAKEIDAAHNPSGAPPKM